MEVEGEWSGLLDADIRQCALAIRAKFLASPHQAFDVTLQQPEHLSRDTFTHHHLPSQQSRWVTLPVSVPVRDMRSRANSRIMA